MDKYAYRYWEVGEKNKFGKECYLLHYTEVINDEIILGFVQDEEDEGSYVYTSKLLNSEYDCIYANSIEEAKEVFEDMINEYLQDQISCIEQTIEKFNELNAN